jgi:hypothetical protein
LLKKGLTLTFRDVQAGARLDLTLRFVPRRGRAVTVGRLRTTASGAGSLTRRIVVTKAGRRALKRGARGRLEVTAVARSGTDSVKLARRIAYRP